MAESGLSGNDVLKFGGASRENPGISEGFHGLGFTLGELDRGNTGFFTAAVTTLSTEEVEDLSETAGVLDSNVGLRVGLAVLGKGFGAGILGLLAGDEALMVDLAVGVEDLGGTGFAEGKVGRAFGVADLEALDVAVDVTFDVVEEGLVAVVNVRLFDAGVELDRDDAELRVGRPVGVDGLDPEPPPEEDGLWSPPVEVFNPEDAVSCLEDRLLLAGSGMGFASLDFRDVGRAFGAPSWLIIVFCDSISKEGKRGVPGGVKSHS